MSSRLVTYVLVEGHDDVAVAKAGASGGAVGFDRDHEHTRGLREVMEPGQAAEQRDVLACDAEIAATYAAITQ